MSEKRFGGLKERERRALNKIKNYEGKLGRCELAKQLKVDKKQGYRIADKLYSFGYVIIKNKKIKITSLGDYLNSCILSKSVNRIYKEEKPKESMVKVKCTKCGKPMEMREMTCVECSEKELEEDKGEWKCDECGKDLFGRTADQEITLFYKDADKDYNFCSKDCLLNFIQKRLN